MKTPPLRLLLALLLAWIPGCTALAKYDRPDPGPFAATEAGVHALGLCVTFDRVEGLCAAYRSMLNPFLLPVWAANLPLALGADLLTLPYDLCTAPAEAAPHVGSEPELTPAPRAEPSPRRLTEEELYSSAPPSPALPDSTP